MTINVNPLNSPDPAPSTLNLSTVAESKPDFIAMELGPAAQTRTVIRAVRDVRSTRKHRAILVLGVVAVVALLATSAISLAMLFLRQQSGSTVEITNYVTFRQVQPMNLTTQDGQTKLTGPGVSEMLSEAWGDVHSRSTQVKQFTTVLSSTDTFLRSAGLQDGAVNFSLQAHFVNESDLTGDEVIVDNDTLPVVVHNGNERVEFRCQGEECTAVEPTPSNSSSLRSTDPRWWNFVWTLSCSWVCNEVVKEAHKQVVKWKCETASNFICDTLEKATATDGCRSTMFQVCKHEFDSIGALKATTETELQTNPALDWRDKEEVKHRVQIIPQAYLDFYQRAYTYAVQECTRACYWIVAVVVAVVSSCFPADATVITPQGPMAMSELTIGTQVQTPNGFQPVYFNAHKDFSSLRPYLTLTTASGHTLTLTGDHYVETTQGPEGKRHYLAKHVTPGMTVTVIDPTTQRPVPSTVVQVAPAIRSGAFNPYVAGGRMVVDGVVASCHSSFLLETVLPEHHLPAVYESMFQVLQLLYTVAPGAVAARSTLSILYPLPSHWLITLSDSTSRVRQAFDNRFNDTGVWEAPTTQIASAALLSLVTRQ